MENLLTPEVVTALSVFAAVVAAQLLKGAVRMISSWVKSTPTNIDDKIWAAVVDAIDDAIDDRRILPTIED